MDDFLPATGPDRILLVRHAQSEWNAAGRWQGQADPPLSPFGEEQAAALAQHPLLKGSDAIVSSDLERARRTAAMVASAHGLAVELDAGLRELDVGSWSGRTRAEIEADEPGAIARYKAGETPWTGGETLAEHTHRARAVAERLVTWPRGEQLVAVSHGGTIRILLSLLLGMESAGRERFAHVHHASVTLLRRSPNGWQLVRFGE